MVAMLTACHCSQEVANSLQKSGGFIKKQVYAICCCFFAIGEYNLISSYLNDCHIVTLHSSCIMRLLCQLRRRLAIIQQHRTRTRTNTNPNDTEANAVGRSVPQEHHQSRSSFWAAQTHRKNWRNGHVVHQRLIPHLLCLRNARAFPLLPAALASVPFGFVLVRVRVRPWRLSWFEYSRNDDLISRDEAVTPNRLMTEWSWPCPHDPKGGPKCPQLRTPHPAPGSAWPPSCYFCLVHWRQIGLDRFMIGLCIPIAKKRINKKSKK